MYFKLFGKTYRTSDTIIGWSFLLPAVILGIIFVIMPIVISLAYSFTDANLLELNNTTFIGFANFKNAFQDKILLQAFKNTMEFVLKVIPLQLGAALLLALILNKPMKGNTFFRWAFFVPTMLSLAVTSMLWINLLNEQDGLINALLETIGLSRQLFLSDPEQAMDLIVMISAWQGAGYQMLIFLSALKNIPKELYEASSIDGANKFQQFWRITLPSIKPTFSFVLITMMIGAFRLITQPMIMTRGGPIDRTLTMSYYIYLQGINFRDVGYSSAIALIYTIFMATIALTLRKVFEKDNTI
ncbi:MAG: carbohydrate ABC transporter permease [Bacilli bacterium]